ncbi:N-acetylglucosamine 6-phosphate deacetylase [Rathayibacter oskolensis]|uniref:N-acetylglucosamine 6-phosphate deacetylase n=1 Tax=Rathayibacter oskolensis TaxID=1891671 RepID=A0A1X7P1A8_9MICO|nr:amidohydrolase family protein [Rathayibacter oskolensis]SMH44414.1 N-acetylglucosamine 6-phosphate deacetylase [Rathayibacter oskolensis]
MARTADPVEEATGRRARTTLLRAARAIDSVSTVEDAWILVEGDRIRAAGSGEAPPADRIVEAGEATLVPGFLDIHGHGGAQSSYDDGPEAIAAALAMHRRHGTTRSVLSLVAAPIPALAASLAVIRDAMSGDPLILGAHLEGPFLSPGNHGAHDPRQLREPSRGDVAELLDRGRGVLRQITLAPELDGALEAIRLIVDGGVVAAVGHTVASHGLALRAFDAGATVLTHAFNAMPGIHHREPGPIMAAAEDERVTLELILDGVHVAPIVARTLFRAVPGRIALITDATAAAGAHDGAYRLGSLEVRVVDGVARVAGTDTIAGSTLTQDAALRTAVERLGLGLQEAITALTATPAAAMGVGDRFGRLAPGYAADVVALLPDLSVGRVWAAGEPVPGS